MAPRRSRQHERMAILQDPTDAKDPGLSRSELVSCKALQSNIGKMPLKRASVGLLPLAETSAASVVKWRLDEAPLDPLLAILCLGLLGALPTQSLKVLDWTAGIVAATPRRPT